MEKKYAVQGRAGRSVAFNSCVDTRAVADSKLSLPPCEGETAGNESGRYDFDLAEFPLFRYYKQNLGGDTRSPLTYTDTIAGKDGAPIKREWKCYPGPFGFGGATTQRVLYELVQLYIAQGCRGSQIQFGTPCAFLLRMWGQRRVPSVRDYERLRRDLDILRGYDFHCRNAFWDRRRQAYVDMHWRLFGDVCYFRSAPGNEADELPFGFIEASRVLQQIARTRGFFCLGFNSELFRSLKPLEQRLALYLSKKFMSQSVHKRYVKDLAAALPVEAARADNMRAALGQTARGLLDARVPTLRAFRFEKSVRTGEWLIVFERNVRPKRPYRMPANAASSLDGELAVVVGDIVQQVGNRDDILWWTKCAEVLGEELVYRGLSELKDAVHGQRVRSRGALLTTIFKGLAKRARLTIQ